MENSTVPPQHLSGSDWSPMHHHVRTYLAGHPLLRGFEVHTAAAEEGVTVELLYHSRSLRASHAGAAWWEPRTPQHGREIADGLAHDLYSRWLDLLRERRDGATY
jgi:hypothetical protein